MYATKIDNDTLRLLWEQGKSQIELAAIFGVSRERIRQKCNQFGLRYNRNCAICGNPFNTARQRQETCSEKCCIIYSNKKFRAKNFALSARTVERRKLAAEGLFRCSDCGKVQPRVQMSSRNGHCKPCDRQYQREWRRAKRKP